MRGNQRRRAVPIAILCCLYAIPFLVLVTLALEDSASAMAHRGVVGLDWKWGNFVTAWEGSRMACAFGNSAAITVGSIAILVASASMAGFVMARYPNRLNKALYAALVGSMMIPGIINTVPLYALLARIGGINSRWAMMLVCATNVLPFSVFLYAGFIKTLPRELEESALIDGCSPARVFRSITFPLLRPVTASVIILNGIGIWNNYGQAVFFLQSADSKTIPLAISMFFQQYGARWNLVAAASVIGVMPAIAVFFAFQKYFIKGIAAGAVKG